MNYYNEKPKTFSRGIKRFFKKIDHYGQPVSLTYKNEP